MHLTNKNNWKSLKKAEISHAKLNNVLIKAEISEISREISECTWKIVISVDSWISALCQYIHIASNRINTSNLKLKQTREVRATEAKLREEADKEEGEEKIAV